MYTKEMEGMMKTVVTCSKNNSMAINSWLTVLWKENYGLYIYVCMVNNFSTIVSL